MKKFTLVLLGFMSLTSGAFAAGATPHAKAVRPPAPGIGGPSPAVTTPVGTMPNTAYEQAVTAYMNNVLMEAQKHGAQASSTTPARLARSRSAGAASASQRLPAMVDVADLPQVEAIMIGSRASARLISASGGLLVVGVHDVTRYGTVTRIDSTGVWLRPEGLSHPILLEDLTPSEVAAESGARAAGAMGPYGPGESIATPPIPISPSPSRLPSGVRRN